MAKREPVWIIKLVEAADAPKERPILTKEMCKQPRDKAIPSNNFLDMGGLGIKKAKGRIKKNLKKLNKIGGNSIRPILLKVVFMPIIPMAIIAKNIFRKGII